MNKYILPACIFAFFMTLPLAAHAKKPKASDEPTFTEQQIALNNEAVEASNVGNYSKAEKLYLASLEMGEFNITWLNLGRIYAKENKCREAEQAYARVTDAPKIKNSQKMNIDGILEDYIRELDEQCSANVQLECESAEMMVTIDEGEAFPCDGSVYRTTPGSHLFAGKMPDGKATQLTVDVSTGSNDVKLIIEKEVVIEVVDNWQKTSKIYTITGWSLLGVGVALAAVGGGVQGVHWSDVNAKKPEIDAQNYKDTQAAWFSMIGVGSAMAVAGAALLVVNHVKYGHRTEDDSQSASDARNVALAPGLFISKDSGFLGVSASF